MINGTALAGYLIILAAVAALAAPGYYALFMSLRRSTAGAVATQDRLMAEQAARLNELEHQRQADHAAIMNLQAEMGRMAVRLELWMSYARRLADIMTESKMTVPPPPERPVDRNPLAAHAVIVAQGELARVARLICDLFSLEEVAGMAWDLGLAEEVSGDKLPGRARSLVDAAHKSGNYEKLIDLCRERRPNGGF